MLLAVDIKTGGLVHPQLVSLEEKKTRHPYLTASLPYGPLRGTLGESMGDSVPEREDGLVHEEPGKQPDPEPEPDGLDHAKDRSPEPDSAPDDAPEESASLPAENSPSSLLLA